MHTQIKLLKRGFQKVLNNLCITCVCRSRLKYQKKLKIRETQCVSTWFEIFINVGKANRANLKKTLIFILVFEVSKAHESTLTLIQLNHPTESQPESAVKFSF